MATRTIQVRITGDTRRFELALLETWIQFARGFHRVDLLAQVIRLRASLRARP